MSAAQSLALPRDLVGGINRLKAERRAVVIAHYYQEPEIQDIADYIGDSLAMARYAQKSPAAVLAICGVHFMAETAKILNPKKIVVLPDREAGCSLADSCPAERFAAFKAEHPGHVVVTYVNTSAAVKALSDYVCTSSNAKAVIDAIPADKKILFAPDKNLGAYLQKITGREMLLWPGTCVVHETFQERHVLALLEQHPGAELIAHPECDASVLRHAHIVGSTAKLLAHTQASSAQVFIVATEHGIIHQMHKASPHKRFIPAAPEKAEGDVACGCSTCPFMKLNTLEKLYLCLRDLAPRVELDEGLRQRALLPIERMVATG